VNRPPEDTADWTPEEIAALRPTRRWPWIAFAGLVALGAGLPFAARPKTPGLAANAGVRRAGMDAIERANVVLSVAAAASSGDPMLPVASERLAEPIAIPECGLTVVEWRATKGYEATTGRWQRSIAILRDTCVKAVRAWPAFARERRIEPRTPAPPFAWSVCLMPVALDRQGAEARNLQDARGRFVGRLDQHIVPLLGFTSYRHPYIFVGNNVLKDDGTPNPRWITVFAHELGHALEWSLAASSGEAVGSEELARAFTRRLGFGE
jgi:hypothetical protein